MGFVQPNGPLPPQLKSGTHFYSWVDWGTWESSDLPRARPFQPGQKVSPAYRKCECFVILTEARSAANRVGTCAIFVTAHPRLKRMRTTFLKPSPISGKLNWGGKFYSCTKVLKEKVFIPPLQGQSMIGCISVLEVFRLNRKVVCYRHSLPLHDFRRLVLHAIFFWVLAAFCRSAWNGVVAIAVAMWKRRSKMLQYTYRVRNSRHLGSRAPNFLSHEIMHRNGRAFSTTRRCSSENPEQK